MAKEGADFEDKVYKADEQQEEPDSEEKKLEMDEGQIDEEVYDEEGREKLVEDGEIDDWEEGFMEGASGTGAKSKCRACGKVFIDETNIVAREINDTEFWFCSENCADRFEKKSLKSQG